MPKQGSLTTTISPPKTYYSLGRRRTLRAKEFVAPDFKLPTASRALGHPPYFSTVVQLSLLSWVHEKSSLAESLRCALEKKRQGTPLSYNVRATPSHERILGVTVACEEQTSSFGWGRFSLAVASMLGLPPQKAYTGLLPTLLRAVLDIFPIIQSLPEHRLIHGKDD